MKRVHGSREVLDSLMTTVTTNADEMRDIVKHFGKHRYDHYYKQTPSVVHFLQVFRGQWGV